MCGRFLICTDDEYREISDIVSEVEENLSFKPGEIFPTNTAPVIVKDRLTFLKWGFYTYDNKLIINARSETIETKPMFRKSFWEKRCLIPANSYFEWKKDKDKKIKYEISVPQRKLFFMAGLYNTFLDKNNNSFTGFVIITTSADESISHIHDRMPAIIEPGLEKLWLSNKSDDSSKLKDMLKPYPRMICNK
ncbi:MAG: SOS response-associated peptidase [Clostridiaceae bacterium]|nr:SOS response-associated peptidase [Clostridiaceae bacterium]